MRLLARSGGRRPERSGRTRARVTLPQHPSDDVDVDGGALVGRVVGVGGDPLDTVRDTVGGAGESSDVDAAGPFGRLRRRIVVAKVLAELHPQRSRRRR